MGIYKLFSQRREEAEQSGVADVYQYHDMPHPLRVQIMQIALGGVGKVYDYASYGRGDNPCWVDIEKVFCREKGMPALGNDETAGARVISFMQSCPTDAWLDLLELICLKITIVGHPNNYHFQNQWEVAESGNDALDEINYRLRRAKVGYQFEENGLVRVDSQFIHAEVVKPALQLLSRPGFDGPAEEFRTAHEHYREGEYRQAAAMAANALESTFKAIFDKKGWAYNKGARISDLVKVAKANSLWPDYLDNSFDQLLATLQSGLPKIRDNDASHGQGSTPRELPTYVAAYALHLAASKIVFIVEAAEGQPA